MRVRRVANTNASACGPLPIADVRKRKYAYAYGSIEAEMSHSRTIRRGTTRRRRRCRCTGSPPVRSGDSQLPHQPIHGGELVRLERVEALCAQPLLLAGAHGYGDFAFVAIR